MAETNLFSGIEHVTIVAKDPKALANGITAHSGSRLHMKAQDL